MIPAADLTELAVRVADGLPIDWAQAESASTDPSHRALLQRLRIVERVAQVHASLPLVAESSLERSLLHPASGEADRSPDAPVTWGSLTIVDKIGRGTFGDVYRARDPKLDRPVALKLLRRRERHADALEQAVIEEGRLMARVRHPNVVTIYGAERIDGRVGLWMELVDGRTLEEELREHGPYSAEAVASIGTDLSRALAAVHRAGLLHRDLKAQNVMRDGDGRVLLTDFGAGRELAQDTAGVGHELAGTPLYLAPEVLDGSAAASQRSDIYSVGVLLYHLATGSFPVGGRTLRDLRDAHARGDRTALRDARADLPHALVAVVDRALSVKPTDRYQTAAELERALADLAESGARRYRSLAAGLAAAAVAVAVVAVMWLGRPESLTIMERDRVVITKFINRTGEPVLDGTLEFALERELLNSAFVNVASREHIDDVLQVLAKPIGSVVDATLGRDIASLDGGVRALLTGRVEKTGRAYVLTAQIVNPSTGIVVRTLREDAVTQAELPPAVRRVALRVREALGENPSTIQASEAASEMVTTPSLRAQQLYSQASAFMHGDRWSEESAEPLLKQAIAEDPSFASAHILLAWVTHNQNRPKEEFMAHAQRALDLASHTSEVERHFIVASYHDLLSGRWRAAVVTEEDKSNLQKAIETYEALMRIKPHHYWAVHNLARAYQFLNNEPDASKWLARVAEVRSSGVLANLGAAMHFLQRGDVSRARTYFERVQALPPLPGGIRDEVLQQWDTAEAWSANDVSRVLQRAGALERQRGLTHLAVSMYLGLGRLVDAERVSPSSSMMVWARVWLGDPRALAYRKQRVANIAVETTFNITDPRLHHFLVSSYVREGNPERARQVAAIAETIAAAGKPARTFDGIDYFLLPRDLFQYRGDVAVLDGRLDDAADAYRSAKEAGAWGMQLLRMASLLASGWRAQGNLEKAINVLEEATNDRGQWAAVAFDDRGGVAYWIAVRNELAELYYATGRRDQARTIDEELLKLLAIADADHPVLLKVNARK